MGIFDLFKPKNKELTLEEILQKAAQEPSFRAAFYKKIANANLIVITEKSGLKEGIQVLEKDTDIKILSLEDGIIPVFTSKERILDNGIIKDKVNFIEMKATTLFEITKGAILFLNPYSDFRKELLPSEIERILDGTIISENHTQLTVKADTKIQIGQPSIYPTEIVNSLIVLFQNRPNVKKAYLGWIHDPKSDEPPHYIFAIDAEKDDFQDLINEAGFTVKEFLKAPEFADFIKIGKSDGLSDYFINETKPFYEK